MPKTSTAIGKKARFEIFKRDAFTCAYCGRTPPAVVLQVDHIHPKSKGGSDTPENLITACLDCNQGKTNIPLSKVPESLASSMAIVREREEQVREHKKLLAQIERRFKSDAKKVGKLFSTAFPDKVLTMRFQDISLRRFLSKLSISLVLEAMRTAAIKCPDEPEDAIKYFCGICWNKIREPHAEEGD